MQPLRRRRSHDLLEGGIERAVTVETTLKSQFLHRQELVLCGSLMAEVDEVLDAQAVDVGIVGDALTGEILAQIKTVGSNSLCKLGSGNVVLQIELRLLAMLLQQRPDVLCK